MDSLQFTPSELIYLFLDGEHSGVERSMLFKAMADNQELQHEFEDALKIRTATLHEAQSTALPAALTQSLMGRAGFTAAGAAVGSAATGWFASMFSHWGATSLMLLLPMLAGSAGYYVGTQNQTPKPTSAFNSNAQNLSVVGDSKSEQHEMQQLRAENARLANSLNEVTRRDISSQANQSLVATNSIPSLRASLHPGSSAQLSPNGEIRLSDENISTAAHSSVSNLEQTQINLGGLQQSAPVIALQKYNVPEAAIAPPSNFSSPVTNSHPFTPHFAVGVRGLSSLSQTLDSLVNPADARSILNFSVSIQYLTTPQMSYVIEAGRENLPWYKYSDISSVGPNDPPYVVQQNVRWIAAGARYSTLPIESIFGLKAFLQGTVGVSDVGVILRPMMGLEWQPDSRVTFHAGLEELVNRSSYRGTSNFGLKTTFSYGVSLNF